MAERLNVEPQELRRAARDHREAAERLRAAPDDHHAIMESLESLGPVFADLREAGREPTRTISHLYQLTMGRPARADELRLARTFLTAQARLIEQRRLQGEPIATLPNPPAGLSPAAAAAWVDLCLATMNLNEFLYVR